MKPSQSRCGLERLSFSRERDMRGLMRQVNFSAFLNQVDQLAEDARKVIYQTVFIAFLAGKSRGAQEAHIKFWSIETNDLPLVEALRQKYYGDFNALFRKLIDEIRAAPVVAKPFDAQVWLNRCDLILQLATWHSYNKGKQALWDDEILQPKRCGPSATLPIRGSVHVQNRSR